MKKANFIIHPDLGHLNTIFGFRVSKIPPNTRYRYFFEGTVGTDWIDSKTFVYYQFKTAGIKAITMEIEDGETISKNINVSDSILFGSGKTRGITIAPKSNIIIFQKSNGLVVYNLVTKQEYYLPINVGRICEIRKNRVLIVSQNKVGLLNLSTGEMTCEYDNNVKDYSFEKKIVIMSEEGKINIIKFYKDKPIVTEIAGKLEHTDINNLRIIYSADEDLKCYYIGKGKEALIGSNKFIDVFGDNNEFVIYEDNHRNIWDINKRKDVFCYGVDQEVIKIGDCGFIAFNTNWGVTKKDALTPSLLGKSINYDVNYIPNDNYSKLAISQPEGGYQIVDYDFDFINYSNIDGQGFFVKWLANGKYFQVKTDEEYFIYTTVSLENIFKSQVEVVDCFYYKGRWMVAINIDDNATIYNLNSGKEILSVPGYIEKDNILNLKKYNQLWIRKKKNIRTYSIYSGLTNKIQKTIHIRSETNDYYLTDDRIIKKNNLRTARIYKSGAHERSIEVHGNRVSITSLSVTHAENLNFIITKEKDGFYVFKNALKKKNSKYYKIKDADKIYTSSDIHPNKKIAVMSSEGLSDIIDLETFEIIKTLDTNFIQFDLLGNIYCSDDVDRYWGVPKIYDPNTFKQIEPKNIHKYKFVSRDGKYGISLSYSSHYELVDLELNDVIAKIPNLYPKLDYTNFIAFHPSKNNELVVTGKVSYGNGYIKSVGFTKVFLYGSTKPTIRVHHNDSYPTDKAAWKCGFSNNGQYLASYDSNPITYIMCLSKKREFITYNIIDERSFVCWVPDSKAIVVSDNSYRARTTGGSGWSNSRYLWIVSIDDGSVLKNYDDHNSEVVSANFSEDGKKMISRSEDGVVIIRAV